MSEQIVLYQPGEWIYVEDDYGRLFVYNVEHDGELRLVRESEPPKRKTE